MRFFMFWGWSVVLFVTTAFSSVCNGRALLQDGDFSRGVVVAPLQHAQWSSSRTLCLPLRACTGVQRPLWKLQQWSSVGDVATGDYSLLQQGVEQWILSDAHQLVQKRLVLAPENATFGDVLLEMDGRSEFAARSNNGLAQYLPDLRSAWPHLLLSQQLETGRLGQYSALQLQGDFRVPLDNAQIQDGYSRAVHAARLVMAITVRNRLTGNYFWLNIPLYDDRIAAADFGCHKCTSEQDGQHCHTPKRLQDEGVWHCPEDKVGDQWWQNEKRGTARMIFRVPTRDFIAGDPERIQAGEWAQVRVDLLPYVRAGIEAARERHNGRTFPRDLFFYELGLFSVGWELTGFNHVAAQLRSWQLEGVIAENP